MNDNSQKLTIISVLRNRREHANDLSPHVSSKRTSNWNTSTTLKVQLGYFASWNNSMYFVVLSKTRIHSFTRVSQFDSQEWIREFFEINRKFAVLRTNGASFLMICQNEATYTAFRWSRFKRNFYPDRSLKRGRSTDKTALPAFCEFNVGRHLQGNFCILHFVTKPLRLGLPKAFLKTHSFSRLFSFFLLIPSMQPKLHLPFLLSQPWNITAIFILRST